MKERKVEQTDTRPSRKASPRGKGFGAKAITTKSKQQHRTQKTEGGYMRTLRISAHFFIAPMCPTFPAVSVRLPGPQNLKTHGIVFPPRLPRKKKDNKNGYDETKRDENKTSPLRSLKGTSGGIFLVIYLFVSLFFFLFTKQNLATRACETINQEV